MTLDPRSGLPVFTDRIVCIKAPCPGSGDSMATSLAPAPYVPSVPYGWSIGPDGQPIPPAGGVPTNASPVLYAEGSVSIPLVSTILGAAAGYFLGKRNGNEKAGAVAGAMVGYFWHPLG